MASLRKFVPLTFNTTAIFIYLVALLFFISASNPNILLSVPFYFHGFAQLEKEDEDEEITIGFGGNTSEVKINTEQNGSIPNIGEINNFDSNSGGLKILVTLNNISNLNAIGNKNMSKNLFLKVEESNSMSPESEYLTYKFKKSDFDDSYSNNSNDKTVLFLFYPGLINDGTGFKVCLYYFEIYDKRIMCKNDVNEFGNKQERIDLDVPYIINLGSLISQINNSNTIYNKTILLKELSISNYDNIDLRYANSDFDDSNLKYIDSINKLLSIDSVDNHFNNGYYLTEINGSNMSDYTEKQISGNNALRIDGFEFNEKNNKIYAFGDYDYFKGSDYDVKYGLASKHNDHTIFVIDPITAKIIDSIKLWGGEEEGDETTIGNIFINYDNNELYVTALGEGELDEIFVIDINTLMIKSVISSSDFSNQRFYGDATLDDINNIVYMCNGDSIIGINIDEMAIVKNISSIYCPVSIDSKEQKGYFVDYQDIGGGFIDFTKKGSYILLYGGNITDINVHNKNAFVVGQSTSNIFSCDSGLDKDKHVTNYIFKIDMTNGNIPAIYKFNNVYIDNLVENPRNGNLYAKTTEIISDSYACYEDSKLYDLGVMA